MGLEGKLEDLPLSDILHIVNLSKRTGLLILTTKTGKSSIVFKNGRIIDVHTDEPVPALGEILVNRKLISKEHLESALKNQGSKPLGVHLIESGTVAEKDVEDSIKVKIIAAIRELMKTKKGEFNFKLNEEIPLDGIGMSPRELPLHSGVDPQLIVDMENGNETPGGRRKLESLSTLSRLSGISAGTGTRKKTEGSFTVNKPLKPLQDEKKIKPAALVSEKDIIEELTKDSSPEVSDTLKIEPAGIQKLVIVDDEALFRAELESFLTKHGFRVYALDTTVDAVSKSKELSSSGDEFVVITDLLMRSVDGKSLLGGLDVLTRIRQINESVPVILMTDHLDTRARHKAYELGVTNYLIKPDVSRIELDQVENDLEQFCEEVLFIVKRLFKESRRFALKEIEDAGHVVSDSNSTSYRQIKAVKKLVSELQNPNETSEISLMVLRLAAEFLERGILFLVKKNIVFGLGGFGETGDHESINAKVKRIQIPRDEDSIFKQVIDTMEMHQGKLKDTMWNRLIIEGFGRVVPREVVLMPLISRRKVVALLYGDNAGSGKPIGNLEGLEIFMSQAGIAMENTLLQRQLSKRDEK